VSGAPFHTRTMNTSAAVPKIEVERGSKVFDPDPVMQFT
jgi:hypothetical protein